MSRIAFKSEFLFKVSPHIIYEFLTTPDCLIRWFCEECKLIDDYYLFRWEGEEEAARLVDDIEEELVRYHWVDSEDREFLEFRISESEVTSETILEITAWCDDDKVNEEKQYWTMKIEEMKQAMGIS